MGNRTPTAGTRLEFEPGHHRGVARRMSEDHERLCSTGEAFVHAATARLVVRRLARA